MSHNEISTNLRIHNVFDYIPVVSTFSNLNDLFHKAVILNIISQQDIARSPYYSYLNEKSFGRCAILLIPFIGNVTIALYEHTHKQFYDRNAVLAAVRDQEGLDFANISAFLKCDPEVNRAVIEHDIDSLEHTIDHFKYNQAFMLAAMGINPAAIGHASEHLKGDQAFMLAAMGIDRAAIEYANDNLKGNQAFMLDAVGINPAAIEHASEHLKDNQAFMLAAMGIDPAAIGHASDNLKGNHDFMLAAMGINPAAIEHASEHLKDNQAFMLAAMGIDRAAIEHASEHLKDNQAFMLAAMRINPAAIEHANDNLKGNQAFMLAAMRINAAAIEHANDNLKGNQAFMLAAMGIDRAAIEHASEGLRGDHRFMLAAIQINPNAREHATPHLARIYAPESSAAIIKIQAIFRGHKARCAAAKEKRHLLEHSLFEQAKRLIDDPKEWRSMPEAPNGRTHVYLPKGLPIVLKRSGTPANKKRFQAMQQARELCHANKYTHLIIPKTRIHGEFIIESRVPHQATNTKACMGLYLDNLEQFAEAAAEFTGFLCQSFLYDITGNGGGCYAPLSTLPNARYDNVMIYLEEGMGKIGLVDLESFDIPHQWDRPAPFSACQQAIRFFPHHLDVIIEAAKKFDPAIENRRQALIEEQTEVLRFFKKVYLDHVEFLKDKQINIENPEQFSDISPSRKAAIENAVGAFIEIANQRGQFQNCLGSSPETTMRRFNGVFPEILNTTLEVLRTLLKLRVQEHNSITSYRDLVLARTAILNFNFMNIFSSSIAKRLDMFDFSYQVKSREEILKEFLPEQNSSEFYSQNEELEKINFARYIITKIFQELKKGREIAYYNPSLISGHLCMFL